MKGLWARRWRLRRLLRLSLQVLLAHRLRTALSVSGLLVGVAAVMVMASVSGGAERRILDQVHAMGTNLLVVLPAPAPAVAGRARQATTLTTLRPHDADLITRESFHAVAAAPAVSRTLVARREGRNTTTTVFGTTPEGLRLRGMRARTGRLFDDADNRERRRVVLLGPTVAHALFGDNDPTGLAIRVGNVPFDVLGVLAPRGTDPGGADLDHVVVLPLETAMRRVLNIPYVHSILVQARSSGSLEPLEAEVRDILAQAHPSRSGTPVPFTMQNQAVVLRTERETVRSFNRLVAGVSLLALGVGAVGIVAVTLLSLRERTREIGLRRALGARRGDIRVQFILESAMLAAAGGATGVLTGLLVSGAAALLGPWDLVLPWRAAVVGLVSSVALGMAAGAVPAARAARLEPMAALRSR